MSSSHLLSVTVSMLTLSIRPAGWLLCECTDNHRPLLFVCQIYFVALAWVMDTQIKSDQRRRVDRHLVEYTHTYMSCTGAGMAKRVPTGPPTVGIVTSSLSQPIRRLARSTSRNLQPRPVSTDSCHD